MAGNVRGNPADGYQEENVVRLPLDVALAPRDGSDFAGSSSFAAFKFLKDPAIINGYVEVGQENGQLYLVKRPGGAVWDDLNEGTSANACMGIYYYLQRTRLNVNIEIETGVVAAAYNNKLFIYTGQPGSHSAPTFTFTGLFPGGSIAPISGGEVEPVYFEGVPLPDLVRSTNFKYDGQTTAGPPLEGFFFNGPFDGYFYNTRSNTLTKIASNYPFQVVGGAAWLNGRFYVMTPEGRIYASGINDPYTWSALDFVNAIMHPDKGTGVWRRHTYIMAMGRNSTEWFYDSGAAVGNPLRRVDSAAHDFGCLHSGSVVNLKDTTLFVGTTERSREKGVFFLEGYVPKKISTPFIDRIIDNGDIDCAWAFPIFYNGHRFYVLNICCFGASLVYDLDTDKWFLWTSQNVTARTVSSLTAAMDTSIGLIEATAVVTPSFSDAVSGDPITIAGAAQSDYNGDFTIYRVLSSTSFTYILRT
ncbi:MAG: hypothetical protein L0Y56_10590, partial [Nitrospira sp.]|nr:hypothetical protein [Nitrospira sp.]